MKNNKLFEEINSGDFTTFDLLTESEQIECMKQWNHNMRIKYLTRNKAISFEEFFEELNQILDEDN